MLGDLVLTLLIALAVYSLGRLVSRGRGTTDGEWAGGGRPGLGHFETWWEVDTVEASRSQISKGVGQEDWLVVTVCFCFFP